MARGVSADLVTAKDIIEFDLDSRPVDTHGLPLSAMFTERYIHGEIYKARPDAIAVVHTHAPSLIPFGNTKVPLMPMYHRSAFIAFGIPVFEIRDRAGMTDMLIRNPTLGHDLADALGDHPAVLMRGHGASVVGPSVPRVVGRTIFLALNATLQADAMRMGSPITYMDIEEARKIEEREGQGLARTWEGWKQKAMGKPSAAQQHALQHAVAAPKIMIERGRKVQADQGQHQIIRQQAVHVAGPAPAGRAAGTPPGSTWSPPARTAICARAT